MNLEEFKASLQTDLPPANVNVYLKALWYDGKQDWEASHNIAQDIQDNNGSWIHAYLHRKEGDIGNAGYWYNRAKKPMPVYSLDREWEEIVASFL
jgi:hypothetical protein